MRPPIARSPRTAPAVAVTALAAVIGCASGGPRVAADTLPPCAIEGAPAGWRQATTGDIRFCVPSGWAAAGPRSWRGPGGSSIDWGREAEKVPFVVTGVGDTGGGPLNLVRTTETIAGVPVQMTIDRIGGSYITRGEWGGQPLRMLGEARSRNDAGTHLDIYRTVRRP